ncbi:hypothetical protein M0722_12890 [Microbacterium sp. KSW4-16]|uniref:hypothetical protein n=1 Tax=Microbacterium aurugineum TaxID=2851642 RepID=UPI0020C0D61A|nr:hypothetical protein [Microbacterium aurugineum]MCK8468092.1 hypothetical protein [Microbacterium aurugineum]
MTRRHPVTIIPASHHVTQNADRYRESQRPDPAPESTPAPAAWEQKPEPEAAPIPKYGRVPRGLQPPAPTYSSPALGMFDEALRRTSDPQVKRRLRAEQRAMNAQIKREIAELPPGADPSAYGF